MSWPFNSAPTKRFEPIVSIALGLAQICMDCEMVTESDNDHCRTCGSHSVLKLARVLEGKNADSV